MSEKINIDFSVSFHVDDGVGGKRKASLAKSKHLEEMSNVYHFVSLNKTISNIIGVYFTAVFTELIHVIKILFRKEKPDILFLRTFFGFFYNWLGKILEIKVIREVHTEFNDDAKIIFKQNYLKQKLGKLVNYLEIKSLRKADGVIFNNPDLEEYFIDNYGLQSDITTSIYNACDPDEFYPADKIQARKQLGLNHDENDILLLFIGSAIQWHGLEYLIDVFKIIKEKKSNYYLYIVGLTDSDYNTHLKNTYKNVPKLHLVNRVSTERARLYINSADVCMVTTAKILISQGSPTKLYDFIACGKPIITQKDVRGYGSVVDEHNLGHSVDFMNPDEAADEIIDFLNHSDLGKLSDHNRKKAVEELNWANAMKKWIDFAKQC